MSTDPQRIGRYVVKRPLGEGGMGTVYLAVDPMLERQVAVKVVRATGQLKEDTLARFRQEAVISAQLNHPNVVMVHDVGEEPGLGPFMALEFVEGHSLDALIEENRLDLEARVRILLQVMRALKAAHIRAIVHRDIKPENILVGEDGRVKLMDFGIACTMGGRHFTEAGGFLGSPPYAAPELLRGEEPSPQSDRYAFSATGFQLLTGKLPHPGTTLIAVLSHVMHSPPEIPADLPADLARVFRKALASDPEDRYENLPSFMAELLHALPLSEVARARLLAELAQGDQAGDVPVRLLQSRSSSSIPILAPPAPAPVPGLPPPGPGPGRGRIELDQQPLPETAPVPTAGAPAPVQADPDALPFNLRKVLLWILGGLVAGQGFWWVVGMVKAYLRAHRGEPPGP